jgi:dUTP pyrophosphatase
MSELLSFYKLSSEVKTPTFATTGSAAFDLRAFFDGTAIKGYDEYNEEFLATTAPDNALLLLPQKRYMIPTGLIFDIPNGYRMDVNVRGSIGLKKGLSLANDTGITDWDYVKELYIFLINLSKSAILMQNGERIAQAKLAKNETYDLFELPAPPQQKTERNGGYGSTGEK